MTSRPVSPRGFGVCPRMGRLNRGRGGEVTLTRAQDARLDRLLAPDRALYAQALRMAGKAMTSDAPTRASAVISESCPTL